MFLLKTSIRITSHRDLLTAVYEFLTLYKGLLSLNSFLNE